MSSLDAVAEASFRQLHGLMIGVAPSGGIRTRYIRICHDWAELLMDAVSGTLRRNVLGAIALEKNDRNYPQRRQPDA